MGVPIRAAVRRYHQRTALSHALRGVRGTVPTPHDNSTADAVSEYDGVSSVVDAPIAFLVNQSRLSDRSLQKVFIPDLRRALGRDPVAVHEELVCNFTATRASNGANQTQSRSTTISRSKRWWQRSVQGWAVRNPPLAVKPSNGYSPTSSLISIQNMLRRNVFHRTICMRSRIQNRQ